MKRQIVIGLLFFAAVLAACSPYPRESERMAEAMRQAEAVYGDGNLLLETDTVLFVSTLHLLFRKKTICDKSKAMFRLTEFLR